jgi:pimeloyl-ACP methyl ester carboxylesterase
MPKIRANGINIHYWQTGRGSDVVLSHGLGGNLAGWHLNIVPELQAYHRVTTYDLRGHGRTDQPESGYSYKNMVEDLKALMDALGIDKADLVGHSQGGDISLQFALVYPERVRRLVVIEAGLLGPLADYYRREDWEGWPYVIRTMEKLLGEPIPPERQHDLEFFLQAVVDIPILYGPSRGQRRDERVVSNVMEFLRPMWKGYLSEKELTVDSLSNIHHPALLLYEESTIFLKSFEVLRDQLSNCKPVLLSDGKLKHFTVLENPAELLAETRAFLAADIVEDQQVARQLP